MLKFLTSLTFLYAFSIIALLLYGWVYYKSFARNRYQKRRFPYVFLLISAGCFSFLYFNINAPLSLRTFSNLDHHFIRHDGFRVEAPSFESQAHFRLLLEAQRNETGTESKFLHTTNLT